MPRIHPKTWEDGVMPLSEFPMAHQERIALAVAQPHPPDKWIVVELGQIPSRAWWEWHWSRGKKLRWVGGPMRRRLPRRLREQVILRDGLTCRICGHEVDTTDVHIDHIHPVSLGGTDELDNLQVAHSLCNIRKGARV